MKKFFLSIFICFGVIFFKIQTNNFKNIETISIIISIILTIICSIFFIIIFIHFGNLYLKSKNDKLEIQHFLLLWDIRGYYFYFNGKESKKFFLIKNLLKNYNEKNIEN